MTQPCLLPSPSPRVFVSTVGCERSTESDHYSKGVKVLEILNEYLRVPHLKIFPFTYFFNMGESLFSSEHMNYRRDSVKFVTKKGTV